VSLLVNFLGLMMFRTTRENCLSICSSCFKSHDKTPEVEGISLMNGQQTAKARKRTYSHSRGHEVSWEHEYQTPHSLNIRGVYLHILEHFLISIIVIMSALLMLHYEGETWIDYVDPAFTLLVVATILYSTVPLFRETLILFMQSVPANIQVKDMEERLLKHIPEILSVHELHVWQLGGDKVVASAHLLFKRPEDFRKTVNSVKSFFRREGIACMTFQPEFLPEEDVDGEQAADAMVMFSPDRCYFKCAKKDCQTLTCCDVSDDKDSITNTDSSPSSSECTFSPDRTSLTLLMS